MVMVLNVVGGVDTHADTHVAAAIDHNGGVLGIESLRHHAEFYGDFADGAWLHPAQWFIRNVVIPNGRLFTVLLIVFQTAVAIAILTRGDLVNAALLAGGASHLLSPSSPTRQAPLPTWYSP